MATKRENAAIVAKVEFGYRGQFSPEHTMEGADSAAVTLTFANGKELLITTNSLRGGLLYAAAAHGLKQKLVDAAAISRNPDTGRSATIEDKYEAVKTVFDRLLSGSWNAIREGGGGSGGLLFRALCRMYPAKTPESLREYLEAKTPAEQAALRKNPRVAAIIEEIKAERGADDATDSDAMLDELND